MLGNVIQGLQHRRPRLQPLGVKLRILDRLLREIPARIRQRIEPLAVGIFRRRLRRHLPAILRPVQFAGVHRAEFLVRHMELLLALVSFLRGLQPLVHLLRQPERVIRLVQNVQHKGRTPASITAWQIILRPCAHLQALRSHALARGTERRARLHTLLLRLAGSGHLGALRLLLLRAVIHRRPLQAHLLHAEIIRRRQFKNHHLRLQHHLLHRLAARGQFRRFILRRLHLYHQRHLGREAQRIRPDERHLALPIHRLRAAYNTVALQLRSHVVYQRARQRAARRRLKRRLRALEQTHHLPADLRHRLCLVLQIIGQLQLHVERLQFRARTRLHGDRLPHIADLEEKLDVLLLRGELEIVSVLTRLK